MSFKPFVRQLGYQPGVQLNPLLDNTDGVDLGNADQVVAMVARMTRGRIDKPIRINRGNFKAKAGETDPMRVSALNEARIQASEALNGGAQELVVMRIVPNASAVKSYIGVTLDAPAVVPQPG